MALSHARLEWGVEKAVCKGLVTGLWISLVSSGDGVYGSLYWRLTSVCPMVEIGCLGEDVAV